LQSVEEEKIGRKRKREVEKLEKSWKSDEEVMKK